jgi:hypothetical protein
LDDSTRTIHFLHRRTTRHSLYRVWSLCLPLAASVLNPQAWHSDRLGRTLVFFRAGSGLSDDVGLRLRLRAGAGAGALFGLGESERSRLRGG